MKLPKAYEPGKYESDIYALWEQSGAFAPKEDKRAKPFSTIMPPPNANAGLHVGHATFMFADIIARYRRLQGDCVLYLPGADHAGFETWVVYEKKLNSEGKTRFDFTREELYTQVWDFVQENKATFDTQFRMLGLSTDWSRFTFTLDDKVVKTAYQVFQKMWNDKLIYRGERLVNYCTFHGTSFSDIEVEHEQQKGKLYSVRYPLSDGSGEVVVATTRPETMFGDTAVAIHPDDPRAGELTGKTVRLPLTERDIPIIIDDFVDRKFGSGAVKITPAHDFTDYDVAQRHDLPLVTVIDHEGRMTHEYVPEKYTGLEVKAARELVVSDLEASKFLVKEEDYDNSIGVCYKCKTVIQPLLREQWFMDMKPLAARAIKALKDGDITFYPASKRNAMIGYYERIRDWNIGRQIAWGIPIPAFQNVDNPDDWIFDERVDQEVITIGMKNYRRDPDVFDTWFSSGQWPYITTNYPDGDDFKKYYPNTLMEVGTDLLYAWVGRMIIFGLYTTGEVPFKTVYMHGMITDDKGQKYSKSKGNAIGVTEAIEQYGSDAVRMGLTLGSSAGSNQPFAPAKFRAGRNFANKLWNIARYIEDKLDGDPVEANPAPHTAADHWMLYKLQQSSDTIANKLDTYQLGEAYDELYHFIWDDVADWYIEGSKTAFNPALAKYVLESILKLAHPFAPFVTEAIWQTIHAEDESLLIVSRWPKAPKGDAQKAAEFEEIKAIVTETRFITSALQSRQPSLYFKDAPFIADNAEIIKKLARLTRVQEVEAGKGMHLTTTKHDAWLDIDIGSAKSYSARLEAEQKVKNDAIARLESRLSNDDYIKKAPAQVVAETKEQLKKEKEVLAKLEAELNIFKSSFGE